MAEFLWNRTGARTLLLGGHKYVRDRETSETINWRCSNFIRHKCRSRAISKPVAGIEMVKLTNGVHTHAPMFGDKGGDHLADA